MDTDVGSREEHLEWCKKRALGFVDQGDLNQAYASMRSDLGKHTGTVHHLIDTVPLFDQLMVGGHLNTADEMRRFIEGFN